MPLLEWANNYVVFRLSFPYIQAGAPNPAEMIEYILDNMGGKADARLEVEPEKGAVLVAEEALTLRRPFAYTIVGEAEYPSRNYDDLYRNGP